MISYSAVPSFSLTRRKLLDQSVFLRHARERIAGFTRGWGLHAGVYNVVTCLVSSLQSSYIAIVLHLVSQSFKRESGDATGHGRPVVVVVDCPPGSLLIAFRGVTDIYIYTNIYNLAEIAVTINYLALRRSAMNYILSNMVHVHTFLIITLYVHTCGLVWLVYILQLH